MSVNSVTGAVLQLGPYSIPLSGEDVVWDIEPDDRAEVTPSVNGDSVVNRIPSRMGTLTIMPNPTHPAHAILRRIVLDDDLAGGRLSLAGFAQDTSSAQFATWSGATITKAANTRAAQTVQDGTWTVRLTGLRQYQSAAALIAAQALT